MSPDMIAFNAHVLKADFQTGIDKGMWGLVDESLQPATWPIRYIWIAAARKAGKPDKYYFKFDLSQYPAQAPTACIWDIAVNSRLPEAKRPMGDRYVTAAFISGHYQGNCMYLPFDREAMKGHDHWKNQYPDKCWKTTDTIYKYVSYVHWLLNSNDYAKF